jgi:hypothetical protein
MNLQPVDMWRNIEGGVLSALGRSLADLVFPRPDLSKVPPLEIEGVSSLLGPGQVEPHLVLLDQAAQSSGLLFTHISDYSLTLALTDGSRNFLAHLSSFFSRSSLLTELERFKANSSFEGEVDYRVGLFVGRLVSPGTVRGTIAAVRSAGLGEFLAVRAGIRGYHTVALEGEGRIVIAPIEAYLARFNDVYRRPVDGADPFDGFGG